MEIKHHNTTKNGKFEAFVNGNLAGEMTYTWAGEHQFIIDHTGVEAAYNGQGVGKQLFLSVVDFARQSKVKVIPLCPFAKASFDKHPEFQDLLS